ncbi:hypothetical protein LCGC14_2254890 [marine sediment metagenome]|uniref:Uncharacterized protein n=1 Tax=marine sediment metagenome TaxID=412755 RepID=A0A0F9D1T0_9ZZZZ
MNNIYKTFIWLSLAIACVALFLSLTVRTGDTVLSVGGITNYDSLQLQPEVSGDNALDVRDSSGTSKFVIDGSGNITTLSGTVAVSGDITATGAFIPDSIGSGVFTISYGGSGDTTSTLSTANVCDNTLANWLVTNISSTTLPDAKPLQDDCLGTSGSYRDFLVRNTGVATATMNFIPGASSTIQFASSTGNAIVAGGSAIVLRFYNVTTTESNSEMIEIQAFEPFN